MMTDTQPSDSKQVLLAEDEPTVRRLTRRVLQSWGYRVFSARNGREALDMAEAHKGEFDLLISDVTMPEMDGQELAAKLTARKPKLKVILLSGYSKARIVLQRGNSFKSPFGFKNLRRLSRTV